MKSFLLTVAGLLIPLFMSTTSFADRFADAGGRFGGYNRVGIQTVGHYRGSPHYGGYYRGGHYGSGLDVFIGGPFWNPSWYYPVPYYAPYFSPYYAPPVISVPSSPPVYIEREKPVSPSAPEDVWYFCPEANAYYPYVKDCPGGWQTVPAQPPSELRR